MGAKGSKSANITTSSPKKDLKEPVVAIEGENHVSNGDAVGKGDESTKNHVNQVIEVAKEELKEICKEVKEIAEEASNDVKEAAKDALKSATTDENKTPTKEEEKKKVQKKRSFRRFSFLRKEKSKTKEDKQKNGDVATPEKKDEVKEGGEAEKVAENGTPGTVAEEGAEGAEKKVEDSAIVNAAATIVAAITSEESKEQVEEKKLEVELPAVETPVKVEVLSKPAEPEVLKEIGAEAAATIETIVQNGNEKLEELAETAGIIVDSVQKEAEKVVADTEKAITNGLSKGKELAAEMLSTESNGFDASPTKEVATAE